MLRGGVSVHVVLTYHPPVEMHAINEDVNGQFSKSKRAYDCNRPGIGDEGMCSYNLFI